MSQLFRALFACSAILAISMGQLSAQESTPSSEDLIVRPGDTITWSPAGTGHQVRFGGSVTHNGATLALAPIDEVKKVLDLNPPPPNPEPAGFVRYAHGEKVVATLRADAATSGVSEFSFTCGFDPHFDLMVTVPFKIEPTNGQPARNVEIVAANPPRWVLKTPQGNKTLTLP